MTVIRTYRVTQERVVTVSASSPAEAVQIADTAFKALIEVEVMGKVLTPIRETDIAAREEY